MTSKKNDYSSLPGKVAAAVDSPVGKHATNAVAAVGLTAVGVPAPAAKAIAPIAGAAVRHGAKHAAGHVGRMLNKGLNP